MNQLTAENGTWPTYGDHAVCRCARPITYDNMHGWSHDPDGWYACRDDAGNPRQCLATPRVLPLQTAHTGTGAE